VTKAEDELDQHAKSVVTKQEAVRVGKVIVLAQHDRIALLEQKQRLAARGYRVSATRHFVVCQKPTTHHTVLLHTFGQAEIDADLICFIEDELPSFGIMPTAQDFGATLFAVLASTFPAPRDQRLIWRHFCCNSLIKLRDHIDHPRSALHEVSYLAPFATMYRRILDLSIGDTLLDVGCSFGFLPVLMSERDPDMRILGCDKNPDAIDFSTDLAEVSGVGHVAFALHDVLDATILGLGTFDTVTAVHLLEHLPERDVALAFTHLLHLTAKRLIIAVPYEQQARTLYGHQYVFTKEKLQQWGQWCLNSLQGAGRFWCEEVAGGMLIIERSSEQE
jgi:SAM-dependent methyltransferase